MSSHLDNLIPEIRCNKPFPGYIFISEFCHMENSGYIIVGNTIVSLHPKNMKNNLVITVVPCTLPQRLSEYILHIPLSLPHMYVRV